MQYKSPRVWSLQQKRQRNCKIKTLGKCKVQQYRFLVISRLTTAVATGVASQTTLLISVLSGKKGNGNSAFPGQQKKTTRKVRVVQVQSDEEDSDPLNPILELNHIEGESHIPYTITLVYMANHNL